MNLPEKYNYLEMHNEFEQALTLITTTNKNLFITGAAGCGKTELIKLLSDKAVYNHATIVACPTGIAAVNASTEGVRAQTLHSLFKLPPMGIIPVDKLRVFEDKTEMFKNLHTLIIDEVSMVNSDLLTKIVFLLNQYRNGKPIRYIVFGDLSQLAPIVSSQAEQSYLNDTYGSRFFFNTDLFKTMQVVQLTKIFRQKDPEFKAVLNRIRFKQQTLADMHYLNCRTMDIDDFKNEKPFIYIALTNRTVNEINTREVAVNSNKSYFYHGINNYYPVKDTPVPEILELKKDVQIMLTANNYKTGYFNGQLGTIVRLEKNTIWVESNDETFTVDPFTWQKYKYEYDASSKSIVVKTVGNYTQFPVKIGYAITSHKAQGLTLERVYLDLERGTFASGQLYTALSRVRSIEGLGLARSITNRDNKLSAQIKKFYKKHKIT